MIRVNHPFLDYAKTVYDKQSHKEAIIVRTYKKGQRLLSQRDMVTKVMVIKTGITKCFFTENNDKDYILEFLGQGEIIGDIEIIRDIPVLCNIEATTSVEVYAFSTAYFRMLLENDIILTSLLMNTFAERLVHTSTRASYQQLYTLEHSLSKLLELQSRQSISLTKEEMASYLGISVRSLNRVLKNLNHSRGSASI